jgi:plastocyanin
VSIRIRGLAVAVGLAAGASALVLPAQAADHEVVAAANDVTFSPATITVNVGDTVTFKHATGLFPHNVKFDDGSFEMPAEPTGAAWTVSRRFDSPGTFRYYCEQHGGPGGSGMAGRVVVLTSGAPPPDRTAPALAGLAPYSGAFAASRGALIKLSLSEAARIDGRLVRRPSKTKPFGAFGTIRRTAGAGLNRFRVSRTRTGRKLTAGEYRLTLTATDKAGNRSRSRTTRFFIRR